MNTNLKWFVIVLTTISAGACQPEMKEAIVPQGPVVITTWSNIPSTSEAFTSLEKGLSVLDAIEDGIRVKEVDEADESVGLGGLPDSAGRVTLDACIMDSYGNAGSVTYLQEILHPISVARMIMDSTDHVILSGDGALLFALSHGFQKTQLLTESARLKWEEWKRQSKKEKADNHDTIGMLAMDADGNLSGGCSTSGMAYKLPGRVGDSPIIGAGLFVDNEVGAATATGKGEEVIKEVGSFLVVELMRQGYSPQKACEVAVERIVKNSPDEEFQVGFVAINKNGETGAFSIQSGFEYTLAKNGETLVFKASSYSD